MSVKSDRSSECATSVPAESGNTKLSAAPASIKRHYIITMQHLDCAKCANSAKCAIVPLDHLRSWIEQHCEYASWQLERGEEGGYLHWCIAMLLKKKNRLSWLKRHFSNVAHIEESHNITAANAYAHKEETRVDGPYFHPPPINRVSDYFIDRGHEYKWWQTEIIELMKTPPNGRHIHWYWEPNGNVGKSVFMRHLILSHNAFPLQNAKTADIAYAFKKMTPQQNSIIFNIPRTSEGHLNFNAIESCLDGMIFSTKYESGFVIRDFSHMIFFANFPPNVECLSKDRWIIKQID